MSGMGLGTKVGRPFQQDGLRNRPACPHSTKAASGTTTDSTLRRLGT